MYFYEIYHKTIRKPGNLGNQLSAAFIVRQMLKWRDGQFDQRPAPLNIEPSWLTNEEVQELLLQKNILLYLDTTTQGVLNDEHVVEHDGWSVFEDVKGKPGLISSTPGAKFTISFQIDPVSEFRERNSKHLLLLTTSKTQAATTILAAAMLLFS